MEIVLIVSSVPLPVGACFHLMFAQQPADLAYYATFCVYREYVIWLSIPGSMLISLKQNQAEQLGKSPDPVLVALSQVTGGQLHF